MIEGPVAGLLEADVGRLELSAPIGAGMDIGFGEIEILSGAAVAGDIDYEAAERSPSLEALGAGEVTYSERAMDEEVEIHIDVEEEEGSGMLASAVWWTGMRGWGYLTKLMVGFVLLLLGGERIAAIGRRAATHPGQSLGIGFIAACVLPVASFLAVVTVVPFPLGLLGFSALAILLYLGQIFAAHAIGDLLLKRFKPGAVGSPYLSLAVGLVPLVLLCSLPWLGNLAWLAATFMGIGGVWAALRGQA